MVEYTLREGLSTGLEAQLGIETERLSDRQVCLDGKHGRSDALLVAEYLGTVLMEAIVYAPNRIFGGLNLHWIKLFKMASSTAEGTTIYRDK